MQTDDWSAFPYDSGQYDYPSDQLEKHWGRLHRGDREPFPDGERVGALAAAAGQRLGGAALERSVSGLQEAWRAYHGGDFARAVELGYALGPLGYTVANKAAGIYATYLEEDERIARAIFEEAAERAAAAIEQLPDEANAHYFRAFNLGRYSQSLSVAKALAQGLGGQIKQCLERALALEPEHAEAHTAMGLYHAEVIDKVGALVGRLTYGADRDRGLKHFRRALALHPESAIARMEYGNGLLMMYGDAEIDRARELYEQAAACHPVDAMEHLDVEQAKAELQD